MKTVPQIGRWLREMVKVAWDYYMLASTMGTWGYCMPLPGEVQETLRRLNELTEPVALCCRARLVSDCCAAEIVLCCA